MAREGYLLHAGEEEIHKGDAELKPDTPKKKWDNFWFYHKWHVVIAIVVIILAAFFIHDMVTKVNPDYEIGMITEATYPSDLVDGLQAQLAKYGEDLNGDGKVVVQVNQYVLSAGDEPDAAMAQMQEASFVKLSADLSSGTSVIFITDKASLEHQQSTTQMFSYPDGTNPKEGAKDYDKMRVPLKDCKNLSSLRYNVELSSGGNGNLYDNLGVSLRVYKGSVMDGDKKLEKYYSDSKKLFDQLAYGK